MAPTVTLHAFAPNDLNGSVLHTITDEDPYFRSLTLKVEREGLGGAELVLARTAGAEMFAFTPELFFRVLVHAYSDTVYYPWGFFLNKRQATVIHREEDGSEEWRFGGAGPKMYLDRAALGIGGPLSGWNVDLENGVWRWGESATVGRILGRIIAQDGNMADPALPDLTTTFDQTDDSSSVAWADTDLGAADEPYTIPIGTSLLESLWDLEDLLELTSWIELGTVASPKFELNVSQGLGADKTGNVFGSGVCLLKEGVNIANDALKVEGHSLRKASHVIVEGDRGKWAIAERPTFTPGDYVKYAKIEYTRSGSVYWLEKAGIRWLKRQDNGEKSLAVEILPGASDATGLYFPAPDRVLWLSNLISVDTSADGSTHTPLDIQPSEDQLVTGFLLETHTAADDSDATALARSWDVTVYLNRERPGNVQKTPDQRSASSGGGGCKCIGLCTDTAITIETSTAWKVTAAGAAPGGFHEPGFDDSALANAVHTTAGSGGSWVDGSSTRWIWNDGDATAGSGEQRNFRTEFEVDEQPSAAELEVSADNGCRVYLNGDLIATVGGAEEGAEDVSPFNYASIVTVEVDPALFIVGTNCLSIEGWNETEATPGPAAVYAALTYDSAELTGASARAARCDHKHHHNELLERDTATAHPASAVTYDPGAGPLTETDVQAALDEHVNDSGEHGGGGGGTVHGDWTSYTPSLTASTTNPTLGSSVISGRYKLLDTHTMLWQASLVITTGGAWNAGSGNWRFGLPSGYVLGASSQDVQVGVGSMLDAGSTNFVLSVEFSRSVATDRSHEIHVADGANPRNLAHNQPVTWATGDRISLSAVLEVDAA